MASRSSLPSLALALSVASLAAAGPCDIYAHGNTPCVAAHSTTRSLYSAYNGPLYQVTRASDGQTTEIKPVSTGGVANSAAQDSFCQSTSCTITVIYDQSGNANNLTPAPPGGAASGKGPNGHDLPANATSAPVTLGGHKVYGVYITPGLGYRIDDTVGVATGNEPEGLYNVVDGTHFNGGCCFDYGNAEKSNTDNGAAHMESIYFGTGTGYQTGTGSGPWVLADLENGLYNSGGSSQAVNQNEPSLDYRFVHGVVKGASTNHWSVRGGNAQSGGLSTYYSGERPSGYYPMKKEGSIILGIGGDNSNWAEGTWYEGCLTKGYPSDQTENSVQANIVAAKYGTL